MNISGEISFPLHVSFVAVFCRPKLSALVQKLFNLLKICLEYTFQNLWILNIFSLMLSSPVTIQDCLLSLGLQSLSYDTVFDFWVVIFSRRDPGGQLVIGCRKATNNVDMQVWSLWHWLVSLFLSFSFNYGKFLKYTVFCQTSRIPRRLAFQVVILLEKHHFLTLLIIWFLYVLPAIFLSL